MASLRYIILTITLLCSSSALAERVTVAVAANFIAPAKVIAKAFEHETGHKVVMSFASTGKLYAQTVKGAAYDLFLSADSARAKKLISQGYGLPNSLKTYAIGQLVFYQPRANFRPMNEADIGAQLNNYKGRYIAVANPKLAPYGQAAMEVLNKHYPTHVNHHKVVKGESVGQVFQMIHTGAAGAGFAALSQVLPRISDQEWLRIPSQSYSPIEQQMVLLTSAKDKPAALAFYEFMGSTTSHNIIRRFGYEI